MNRVETAYDVIVVGSGGAGLRAALSSVEKGAKVLVLTKGEPQRSGGTLSAHYSFCAVPPISSIGDTPEQFAEDIIRSSEGISDPSLVRVLTERAYEAIAYAEALGVKFDRTEDGSDYHLGWVAGHTHARAFHVGNVVGRDLTKMLMRRLQKQQVEIHAFTQVLQLHVEQGQYKGLFAYHYPTDELRYYSSKAVVIATGGGSQLYELNTNPVEATGDGYSLALQAGIELVDMEFVQFYPTVLVAPRGTRGLMFNSGIVIPRGATIKNTHGQDVWERNRAGDIKRATRDMMSKVMAAEIGAGYGTENGGLIVDASTVDDEDLPQLQQQLLTDLGVDGASKRYEVAPGAHYFMGGIRIDPHTATSVKGVFAAGECTGGLHGANRLAGNALSENQVFGAIAGHEAAGYALSRIPEVPGFQGNLNSSTTDYFQAHWGFVFDSRQALTGSGGVVQWTKQLKSTMQRNVGVNRSEPKLRQALLECEHIEDALCSQFAVTYKSMPYNKDRMKAIGLRHMLMVAKAVIYSALERRESRGAHNRADFPEKQSEYQVSVAMRYSPHRWPHTLISR
ncbi:FAD-dependent oxidoreductase [Paenibacillus sp. TH7-28]